MYTKASKGVLYCQTCLSNLICLDSKWTLTLKYTFVNGLLAFSSNTALVNAVINTIYAFVVAYMPKATICVAQ